MLCINSNPLKKSTLKIMAVLIVMLALTGCVSSGKNSVSGSEVTSDERKIITGLTSSINDSGAVLINVEGNTNLTYTSLKQSLPLSIVLYFPGTSLEGVEEDIQADGNIVNGIKTSQQDHESGSDSRVKILLNNDADYEISKTANGLEILLSSSGSTDQINGSDEVYDADATSDEVVDEELMIEETEIVEDDEIVAVADIEDNAENDVEDADDGYLDYTEDEVLDDEIVDSAENMDEEVLGEEISDDVDGVEIIEGANDTNLIMAGPASKVLNVSRKIINDYVEINIDGDGTIKDYDIFTIPQSTTKSARIVCDIKNIDGIKTKGEHIVLVNSNGVDKVRYFTYPDKMRIVIDVDQSSLSKFSHKAVSSGLAISIGSMDNDDDKIDVAENIDEDSNTYEENEEILDEETDSDVAAKESTMIADDYSDDYSDDNNDIETLDDNIEIMEENDEVVSDNSDTADTDDMEIQPEQEEVLTEAIEDEEIISDDEFQGDTETETFSNTKKYTKPAWVNRIDFLTGEKGKSSIVIGTSHPVEYKDKKKDDKTLHFRLVNAKLPKSRKLPFITTRFESAVNRILPVQTSGMKNNALFIIELRESVPYFIDQQAGTLTINFEPSSVAAVTEDKSSLPEWQEVLNQTSEIAEIEQEAAQEPRLSPETTEDEMMDADETIGMTADDGVVEDEGMADANETIDSPEIVADTKNDSDENQEINIDEPDSVDELDETDQIINSGEDVAVNESETVLEESTGYVSWAHKKTYKGEKISVDFYETDIKNILRIIRAVSGENFAVDKDVNGRATMTLDNPVPWDQVLDLVLKMNMLGMVSEGGINRIATLDTLQTEEEKRLQFIAAEEKTKRKQKALQPLVTKYILINYADAESEIKPLLEKILTEERGVLSIDKRTNQVIITDTEEKIDEALELIKKLDKITSQVIIEARIVEASTNFSRSLGTEWGVSNNKETAVYNDALGGTYGWDVAMNNPVASNSSFGFNFTRLAGAQFLLNAKLLAMENKGEGKIISAPKLITLDNKKAEIKQGYSYPYRVYEDGAAKTNFIDIVLKLEVTPHVTSDKKISMQIKIDKDDVAEMTDDGPAIAKNNITTELLIDDGDTIVIGGVVKATQNKSVSGFPFLSKIPVIGWLFKSKTNSETKQELLIFLTPRIATFVGDL